MERTIRVTGRGKLSLKPDTVRLRIELEDFAKEYEESIRKSAESTKEVQEAFMVLGFERSELKTTGFDVNARYEYYKDKKTGNQKSCTESSPRRKSPYWQKQLRIRKQRL